MPSLPRARSSIADALATLGKSDQVTQLRNLLYHLAAPLPIDLAETITADLMAHIDLLVVDARAIAAKIDEYEAERDADEGPEYENGE